MGIEQTLVVIADASGSMEEMGKAYLARNLLRFISQLAVIEREKYAQVCFRYYAWAENIREINNGTDNEIKPAGRCNAEDLVSTLKDFKQVSDLKCLLLSDGSFDFDGIEGWPALGIICRGIAVGVDADPRALAWFSGGDRAYPAEDIHAVTDWLIFSVHNTNPPKHMIFPKA